jgi:hypothetical protein
MTSGLGWTSRLTDSSLYYFKSLPLSACNQIARDRIVTIAPKECRYTPPG